MSDDRYEEVFEYDDEGNEVGSYVERVVETGDLGEEPPDDYYDERADDGGPVVATPWAEGVTPLPIGVYDSRGYSEEPPF